MILATSLTIHLAAGRLGADETVHNPYDGAVPVIRFTFENDGDLDFDGQPDDWTRRKGPTFPNYVEMKIDRERGHDNSDQSLRIDVNGGQAIMYSPPKLIDSLHTYVFEGYIRTQRLEHAAAVVSVSFLNHKRQRVQRFLTRPVTGTHRDWVRVGIDSMVLRKDVRFAVIGCHLLQGRKMDIRGAVWFDDFWLGMLPQLSLVSNFKTHFKEAHSPIKITSNVSGLDSEHTYKLFMQMTDEHDHVIDTREFALDRQQPVPSGEPAEARQERKPVEWTLNPQPHGFYRVKSTLLRDGVPVLDKNTTFAVMDLVQPRSQGEFGWSIGRSVISMDLKEELAEVATQAGINWLKYPLWQSVYSDDNELPAQISEMLDTLNHRGIIPVGLLSDPPPTLRNQFAAEWTGISEIFTMSPSFWSPSLEKVIARYSSQIRHWHLGEESDGSFIGLRSLPETIAAVKGEFDRIGRDTRIGFHWNWETPLPPRNGLMRSFVSINNPEPLPYTELIDKLKKTEFAGLPRWVLLEPLVQSLHSDEERAAQLIKQMVAAKIGGAEAIFASDVFDPDHGLMNPQGSPTQLFLPWRTTALALQGTRFLGSFKLASNSKNFVFSRDGEIVLVVWNDDESSEVVQEAIYLGEDAVVLEASGRYVRTPRDSATGQHLLPIGPSPLIIRNCSEPIARWRITVQFEKGQLPSQTGTQRDAILGVNAFRQGVSGEVTVHAPHDWRVEPHKLPINLAAGESFRLPLTLELPSNTSLGTRDVVVEFNLQGEPYPFQVIRPYEVGLGDVMLLVTEEKLPNGDLKITQTIINNTSPLEILNFDCSLEVPNRKRQRKKVIKLDHNNNTQSYRIPNADSLRGSELRLRAQQVGGLRVLNKKLIVGETWDKKPDEAEPQKEQ